MISSADFSLGSYSRWRGGQLKLGREAFGFGTVSRKFRKYWLHKAVYFGVSFAFKCLEEEVMKFNQYKHQVKTNRIDWVLSSERRYSFLNSNFQSMFCGTLSSLVLRETHPWPGFSFEKQLGSTFSLSNEVCQEVQAKYHRG